MDENKTNKRDNKKFVDTMTRKTHFTEVEIERLLELHHKTMVSLEYAWCYSKIKENLIKIYFFEVQTFC